MGMAFKCDDCEEVKEGWPRLSVTFSGAAVAGDLDVELCDGCRGAFTDLLKKAAAIHGTILLESLREADDENVPA